MTEQFQAEAAIQEAMELGGYAEPTPPEPEMEPTIENLEFVTERLAATEDPAEEIRLAEMRQRLFDQIYYDGR